MLYLRGGLPPPGTLGQGLVFQWPFRIFNISFLALPVRGLVEQPASIAVYFRLDPGAPHCVSTQWTRSVYRTSSYCLEDLLNQSIFLTHAFIQECPWRCARCALPNSEYLVCSNLCPWRGAQRSKCHYIIWPCFVVKIWH